MKQPFYSLFVLCLLFVATWTPRVVGLDHAVTVDERKWLARSGNFFHAISQNDWASTFQSGHPGVTIMWAGTLGFAQRLPGYAQAVPSAHWDGEALEAWLHQAGVTTPLELLVAGRWWVVLTITLLITASYLPLRRLFGGKIACLLVLFVAWDPFLLALSRQLHPDGLVANFIYLAWLYLLVWFYTGQARSDLILAGILMGLGWLTKVPAILLLPAGGLLFLVEIIRAQLSKAPTMTRASLSLSNRRLIIGALLWGAMAILTFVGLWPAMWANPVGTLRQMALEMTDYVEGHVSTNYFWGQTVDDPGYFFYLVAYLFRTTPATLIGLGVTCVLAWRRWWPLAQPMARHWAGGLVLLGLTFAVGMTFGGKKFDRYLLPVFPIMDLLAALGWVGLAKYLVYGWYQRKAHEDSTVPITYKTTSGSGGALTLAPYVLTPVMAIVLTVTMLLQGLFGFVHYPYYLTYYNPLFGGSATAPKVLMVGWGEGLEDAAVWLNQQPNAENLRVVSTYGDGPLSYYLHSKLPVLAFWTPDFWADADYAVLYVNQWQRRPIIPEIVDYFSAQTPVHVVRLHGLEMARIYDMRGKTPPGFAGVYTESAANFDHQLFLAAYSMGTHTFLAGDRFVIRLYWKNMAPQVRGYVATLRLIAPDGQAVAQSEHPLTTDANHEWPLYAIRYDEHALIVPATAESGVYTVQLALIDSTQRTTLQPISTNQRANPIQGRHVVTAIEVQAAQRYTTNVQWGDMQLETVQYKTPIKPGETLFVDMTMNGNIDSSLKLSARLVDPAGVTLAQTDKPLASNMRFDLSVPTEATTGLYHLVAVLYNGQTLASIPDNMGDHVTILSTVDVIN